MAGDITMRFIHPNGNVVSFDWHPKNAGQMRLFYEKKGFIFIDPNAPEPTPAQEETISKTETKKRGKSS